ncbi:MAG: hypothetical protein K8R53_04090 [Bacteroidales bacterium]|nr:hypothetical protein [Bacteroidales bacterium]
MILGKIKIWFTILLLIVIIPLKICVEEPDDVQYKFTQTDSSYTFYGSFRINANPECLLEISFNYEHIRALAPDAEEVRLIDKGNNWNQISYTYQKFTFFKNKTVWHRVLNEENQRVDFTLVSSENNLSIMPRMISSKGFYQIKQQGEYSIVEYYQQCQLSEGLITKLYLDSAKKEAIKFLNRFLKYADTFCNRSESTAN